jgi:nitroreductase/ketosteroid isomerase-like protein
VYLRPFLDPLEIAMRRIPTVFLLAPLLALAATTTPVAADPAPDSLRGAFDAYVRAVQGADIDALFEVVTEGDDFFFITASGERIHGVDGYRRFHEEWFSETGWSMPVSRVRVRHDGDRGRTLAVFHYRQALDDGTTYNLVSQFTLLWRRESGEWRVYGDICSPIERYYTAPSGQRLYSEPQREVVRTLLERRTVRRFTDQPVPDEHLRIILDAARHAPTAGNQQPWRFLIVRDRDRLDSLKTVAADAYMERHAERAEAGDTAARRRLERVLDGALSAPVYIAVLADRQAPYPEYVVQDATLAAGNLMNAARTLGYGTGFFTTFFPDPVMRPFFGIPERYTVVCFTPVGVPEEWPDTPPKKPLDALVVDGGFEA